MARELTTDAELRQALESARTVAVLGASTDPARPSREVGDYLARAGYRVLPVSAPHAGATLWGEPVRATLAELPEPVDLVDVFRRPEALDGHLDDLLALRPPPRVVWLQHGVRNDPFAERLIRAGIDVVQDRCTKAEHRRLVAGGY